MSSSSKKNLNDDSGNGKIYTSTPITDAARSGDRDGGNTGPDNGNERVFAARGAVSCSANRTWPLDSEGTLHRDRVSFPVDPTDFAEQRPEPSAGYLAVRYSKDTLCYELTVVAQIGNAFNVIVYHGVGDWGIKAKVRGVLNAYEVRSMTSEQQIEATYERGDVVYMPLAAVRRSGGNDFTVIVDQIQSENP